MERVRVRKPFWTTKTTLLIVSALVLQLASSTLRILVKIDTLNGTIFGYAIGIWLACTFGFLVRDPVFIHIEEVLDE